METSRKNASGKTIHGVTCVVWWHSDVGELGILAAVVPAYVRKLGGNPGRCWGRNLVPVHSRTRTFLFAPHPFYSLNKAASESSSTTSAARPSLTADEMPPPPKRSSSPKRSCSDSLSPKRAGSDWLSTERTASESAAGPLLLPSPCRRVCSVLTSRPPRPRRTRRGTGRARAG